MSENEVGKALKKIAKDVATIKTLLRITARETISSILEKIATTPERQQMWRLADGKLSNEQISQKIGVSLRSVQYFIKEAEEVGLVTMVRRGYPRKVENIIPQKWKPWKSTKLKEFEEK